MTRQSDAQRIMAAIDDSQLWVVDNQESAAGPTDPAQLLGQLEKKGLVGWEERPNGDTRPVLTRPENRNSVAAAIESFGRGIASRANDQARSELLAAGAVITETHAHVGHGLVYRATVEYRGMVLEKVSRDHPPLHMVHDEWRALRDMLAEGAHVVTDRFRDLEGNASFRVQVWCDWLWMDSQSVDGHWVRGIFRTWQSRAEATKTHGKVASAQPTAPAAQWGQPRVGWQHVIDDALGHRDRYLGSARQWRANGNMQSASWATHVARRFNREAVAARRRLAACQSVAR